MTSDLFTVLGGLGLFLIGMSVMTDGLHGLAGGWLNRTLARMTGGPLRGAATGAVTTALLQSSSATTVAAVGFVSAGLLTFPQGLGVIFGANLGTTVTGWLVALLGLKLQIGDWVMPLIFVGALARLFGHGAVRHVGFALAGFGLIFFGISQLQAGMAGYQGVVTPADFPSNDIIGRLQLVAIGIAVTIITQSSSAGVATALTAVHAGAISFEQAAALVIGMDVGTTVTALIAAAGGSVETRRTAYSHVVYNLLTGLGAFLLLVPYTLTMESIVPGASQVHAEVLLVGFHSLFNLVGVMLVLPFARHFVSLMQRLVPETAEPLLDRLDRQLLRTPDAALDQVARVLNQVAGRLLDSVADLASGRQPAAGALQRVGRQLDTVHRFVDRVHLMPDDTDAWPRLNAAIFLLDHLQRLHERCDEEPERGLRLSHTDVLAQPTAAFLDSMKLVRKSLDSPGESGATEAIREVAEGLRSSASQLRSQIMSEVAQGRLDVPEGTSSLESLRWLRRVSYHVWRAVDYASALNLSGLKESMGSVSIEN
jgi:phosphate:Na+ symporter